jgi:hypothetical protein
MMLLGVLAAGCTLGPELAGFGPAYGPAGAALHLTLTGARITGELLAVEDSVLLIAIADGDLEASGGTTPLVRVWTRAISDTKGPHNVSGGWGPDQKARYRMIARYPAGVSPGLERRLLEAYHTDAVRWIRP